MLRLTAVRLINWYHYVDEIIPVRGNTLLCGDNGSGKTTILDAVQLALVGDASECEFNRAAQNQTRTTVRRSLAGYVRHQTGEEDGQKLSYSRPLGTTGYIMLEFRDETRPERDFTCGIVIETKETSCPKRGFFLPKKGVSDVPALTPEHTVRPARDFRVVGHQVDVKLCNDVDEYRKELRHRLGRVPEHFHRLIVKALEFRPMATVKDFVIKYLAEPKPINSQPLLENINHYRQMDREAADAEEKIAALTEVCRQGEAIQRDRQLLRQYDYLVLRARLDEQKDLLEQGERESAEAIASQERAAVAEAAATRKRDAFRREEQRLRDEIAKSPAHRQVQQLNQDLTRVRGEIKDAEADRKQLADVANAQHAAMDALAGICALEARRRRPDLFDDRATYGLPDAPGRVDDLRARLREASYLQGHDLHAWEVRSETAMEHLHTAKARLFAETTRLKEEGNSLAAERRELDQGRLVYPEGARGVIEHLKRQLKGSTEPRLLCEVIEVPEVRWRDAVEMALGARRLFLLVDPADYDRAAKLYERFRRDGHRVFGTGIIDLDRVRRERRGARPRSLAEQVETHDPDARAYVDFLLGDLICVDDVKYLRQHPRAITDTGATYGSAAMSNADPRALDRRYIGRAAKQRRLDEIDTRLTALADALHALHDIDRTLTTDLTIFKAARTNLRTMDLLVPRVVRLPELRTTAAQLEKAIAAINLGDMAMIDAQLNETVALVFSADQEVHAAIKAREAARVRTIAINESSEVARKKHVTAMDEWRRTFPLERIANVVPGSLDDPWREFEVRYAEERRGRSPEAIGAVYVQKQKEFATRIANSELELVKLKTNFNARHYEINEPLNDGFGEYRAQRTLWEESKLPQYRAEIAKAKALAVRQMGEDIVCRLHENFAQLRQDIRDLNAALRDLSFGNDRFEFKLEVATGKRTYYDVIMRTAAQPMSAESDPELSLFDGQPRPIDSLTNDLVSLVENFLRAHDDSVKTELEEIADYREYFTYDLKITHAVTGNTRSYDFIAGIGSGGEVQSALYIAFLASLYQMYRANTRDRRPLASTVLLDEAFGKNDGKRIAATLKFARTFGLQLILAMPAERMDLLGPQMDTTIFLHKDATTGAPLVLDFTKEFDDDALQAATLAILEAEGETSMASASEPEGEGP
ncbi:SbcC/MukB-like Walker B domain-containing protein [Myxococcus xanthus]|uniref:SbcC/MukB-like Walker B domain-containing protein n=1 Tax=Myxococcus xanthus TaxID=34 RepID=UPI00112DDAA8|nr:SbcC/MukB-like Walker B domain-containing protein [Myxococcus xanthus]QDE81672.1 hypothetical protein BHS07_08925 [Myxococcus xanthus]